MSSTPSPTYGSLTQPNLAPIYEALKAAWEAPNGSGSLNETVSSLTTNMNVVSQEAFLYLARQHPFAFGSDTPPTTFAAAVSALHHNTRAMTKNGYKKDSIENHLKHLQTKTARAVGLLLRALHLGGEFKTMRTSIEGRSCAEATTIMVKALQRNPNVASRALVTEEERTKEVLSGKGYFAAPAFLDRCYPHLFGLNLSKLWIKYVLPDIGNFISLRTLDLSANPLVRLPDSIGELKCLRILNVERCPRLKLIPATIGKCSELRKLLASETSIEELPESLAQLNDLKVVDVRNSRYNLKPTAAQSNLYTALMIRGVDVQAGGTPLSLPNQPVAGIPGAAAATGPQLTGDIQADMASGAFPAFLQAQQQAAMQAFLAQVPQGGQGAQPNQMAQAMAAAQALGAQMAQAANQQPGGGAPPQCPQQ